MDVDDDERQLEADRQTQSLRLQVDAGPARGGDTELAGEHATDRGADLGDFVFGLQSADPEVLVPGELVEDVGGGGDRVRRVQERQSALL